MKYHVANGKHFQTFIDEVNELIAAGWEPLGGIAVNNENDNFDIWYYQAMIKK